MIKGQFPVEKFQSLETPFYYYDINLLRESEAVKKRSKGKIRYTLCAQSQL